MASWAQKVETIAESVICIEKSFNRPEEVKIFKDALLLTLRVDSVFTGDNSHAAQIEYRASIENESPVIQLRDGIGMRVSIARIYDNNRKYYIYAIHFYYLEEECWHELETTSPWRMFQPGTVTSGYTLSTNNKKIGFKGELRLE